jgi:beta-glucosidase
MWQPGFHPQVSSDCFSARYSGRLTPTESGSHTFGLMSFGLSRLWIDGRELIDNWTQQSPGSSFFGRGTAEQRGQIELQAGREVELRIDFQSAPEQALGGIQFGMQSPLPEDAMERAVSAAASAEVAILVVGTNGDWETEGNDRLDMELPGRQAELIERVVAANPRTVVVMNTGSPVRMDWLEEVPSVLQAWFPGQEFGNALADLLFGDVNPSGKLPTSFPVRLEDTPAFTNYPGENGEVLYGEGLFVGYRWYDGRDIEPLLPFGHGLSYTTFGYGNLRVGTEHRIGDRIPVRIDITNTGERAGQEVVQLYVKDLESTPVRPPKELKAFAKVMLEPGQTRTVEFELDERALAYWDPSIASWATEPGEFELLVGSSSRDIRSTARFMIG